MPEPKLTPKQLVLQTYPKAVAAGGNGSDWHVLDKSNENGDAVILGHNGSATGAWNDAAKRLTVPKVDVPTLMHSFDEAFEAGVKLGLRCNRRREARRVAKAINERCSAAKSHQKQPLTLTITPLLASFGRAARHQVKLDNSTRKQRRDALSHNDIPSRLKTKAEKMK